MQKQGDIISVKDKTKVEIHKNIFCRISLRRRLLVDTGKGADSCMQAQTTDTIAAVATGLPGAIGILRLSGPKAVSIAAQVFRAADGKPLESHAPRSMVYGSLLDQAGKVIDRMVCTYSRGPASYTGEDTAELQCHGSALVLQLGLPSVSDHRSCRLYRRRQASGAFQIRRDRQH